MSDDELVGAWRNAPLGEVAWVDARGRPEVAVVVPLLDGGRPALALPYADLALARSLAAAAQVTWTLSVPAVNGRVAPVAAAARVEVVEDPAGEAFLGGPLLAQVLAKHPPARRRLDSPLLRREHRWYLPRLLVRTTDLGPTFPLTPGEGLVVTVRGGELADRDAEGVAWLGTAVDVRAAEGSARVDVPDGPAVLLQHGADLPELETPWHRRWRGQVAGGRLTATERDEVPPATRRPALRDRVRAERDLARACREGLRAAGHRP